MSALSVSISEAEKQLNNENAAAIRKKLNDWVWLRDLIKTHIAGVQKTTPIEDEIF